MPCMRESWSYSASALSKSARRRRPLKGWALLDAAKASPHRPLPHCLFREYSRHMTDTLLPAQLVDAARKVLDANRAAGRRIAVAESCTGGLVAAALTEIPCSTDVFETGEWKSVVWGKRVSVRL